MSWPRRLHLFIFQHLAQPSRTSLTMTRLWTISCAQGSVLPDTIGSSQLGGFVVSFVRSWYKGFARCIEKLAKDSFLYARQSSSSDLTFLLEKKRRNTVRHRR